MLDSDIALIEILGVNGFSGNCISNRLRARGSPCSTGTVYKYLKRAGVKLWDYRNGKTSWAVAVVTRLEKPTLTKRRK
jgi:hypothetical protein